MGGDPRTPPRDPSGPCEVGELRRNQFWFSQMITLQWQFFHAQRGLLPSFNEAGTAHVIRRLFNRYRSYEGWWERGKPNYFPEFVEFVEEQRSKAA